MDVLIVLRQTLLGLQVCTTLDVEAAVREANRIHPPGTSTGWCFDEDCEDNPCQCADHPERKHMVFVC